MLVQKLRKDHLRQLLAEMIQPTESATVLAGSHHQCSVEWATEAGLIDEQGLTSEGRLVAIKDPYLETVVTDWLIHFNLSNSNWLWQFFVNEFLLDHSSFSKSQLMDACAHRFAIESVERSKEIECILDVYSEKEAIAGSNFLSYKNGLYSTGSPNLSNLYTTGYFLAKVWKQEFDSQSSILVERIFDADTKLSNILGIKPEELINQFNLLAEADIIEQRSARPFPASKKPPLRQTSEPRYQVYRTWETALELLEKAYENDIATPNRPLVQSLGDISNDDDVPDFSQFLEWAAQLTSLDGGLQTIFKLVS